jgi:hypothetical protein
MATESEVVATLNDLWDKGWLVSANSSKSKKFRGLWLSISEFVEEVRNHSNKYIGGNISWHSICIHKLTLPSVFSTVAFPVPKLQDYDCLNNQIALAENVGGHEQQDGEDVVY